MRTFPLAALCLLAACPPNTPTQTAPHPVDLGGVTVTALPQGGLLLEKNGKELLRLQDVMQRHAVATFDMEFGMFNVQEDADASWTKGDGVKDFSTQDGVSWNAQAGGGALAGVTVKSPEAGHLVVEVKGVDAGRNRTRVTFPCAAQDHFVGLGAQTHDVDHRGQRVPLWVSEQGVGTTNDDVLPSLWQLQGRRHTSQIPMPAVVTSRGTSWLLESSAYAVMDFCSEGDSGFVEVWEGVMRLHVLVGDAPLDAAVRLTSVTGRPRMPAPWAFAPWHDAIFGPDSVLEMATFLRDNHVPAAALWTEDFRGGVWDGNAYRLDEDWKVDPVLYPDLPGLVSQLRAKGLAMQLYYNTFLYPGVDVWPEALAGDHLIKDVQGQPWLTTGAKFTDTGFADLTNPATRTWIKSIMRESLDRDGVLGWMADFGEWMPVQGAQLHSGEDPALVHNRYTVLWQQVNDEVQRESGKQDETLVYYRSGHVGSQALAQVVWAGDQRTSFQDDDGLPTVLPIGLGLAATGFPFFSHDVGGYQSATNPPGTQELFFRWTVVGALSPVMRTHHGTNPLQNWNFRKDAMTLEHYTRWARFHVQLYPYWRTLAHRAVELGEPLWRSMGLMSPADEAAWAIKDQFWVGPSILVAPVLVEGATSRTVHIPAGRFAPWGGGPAIMGPQDITVQAPMTELPMFLAAGGLVPLTAQPVETLFANVPNVPGLETVEGDRLLYVGLGAAGRMEEESGAAYELTGAGTGLDGLTLEQDGSVVVTGNGTVTGQGFSLVLSGHPEGRHTRVFLR